MSSYDPIETYSPYIVESLRDKHPEVNSSIVGELTFYEFQDIWKTLLEVSGIKLSSIDKDERQVDWAFVFSRLACCLHLSYRQVEEFTLNEAEEVFEFLSEFPTDNEILIAVHGVKTKGMTKRKAKQTSEALMEAGFRKIHDMSDMPSGELDNQFKDSIEYAKSLMDKMKMN